MTTALARDGDLRRELGVALTMELASLSILGLGVRRATDDDVVDVFRDHRIESRDHVVGLGQVFRLSGWDVDGSGCPFAEALWAQSRRVCHEAATPSALDGALVTAAIAFERHEIDAYENLIARAEAIGDDRTAEMLQTSLDSERHALALLGGLAIR